jgi:PIN domain nuclease of toxin-antitoxin system
VATHIYSQGHRRGRGDLTERSSRSIQIESKFRFKWKHARIESQNAAKEELDSASSSGRLRISVMSIWEIAMLVAQGRLAIPLDVPEWTARALAATGVQLVDLALRVLKANR